MTCQGLCPPARNHGGGLGEAQVVTKLGCQVVRAWPASATPAEQPGRSASLGAQVQAPAMGLPRLWAWPSRGRMFLQSSPAKSISPEACDTGSNDRLALVGCWTRQGDIKTRQWVSSCQEMCVAEAARRRRAVIGDRRACSMYAVTQQAR
mmetsp:Transcript_27406/g.87104  ORF Transcript_27406/g.87104 Transcript_27406/m.87104 type:complete len:150 (+) Transcript_27406:1125-1574(+)